jgi:hypothetical protein
MKAIRSGFMAMALAASAAAPLAIGAVGDGNDCGGFTADEAAVWLKVPAGNVVRDVARGRDGKWACSYSVGKAPAIAFSVAVAPSAKRAADELERYRDDLATAAETARWKNKLPNGVYSDMFGAGDEGIWTDINGTYTVRRDNVTVQVTLPKGKDDQLRLGKAVVEGF